MRAWCLKEVSCARVGWWGQHPHLGAGRRALGCQDLVVWVGTRRLGQFDLGVGGDLHHLRAAGNLGLVSGVLWRQSLALACCTLMLALACTGSPTHRYPLTPCCISGSIGCFLGSTPVDGSKVGSDTSSVDGCCKLRGGSASCAVSLQRVPPLARGTLGWVFAYGRACKAGADRQMLETGPSSGPHPPAPWPPAHRNSLWVSGRASSTSAAWLPLAAPPATLIQAGTSMTTPALIAQQPLSAAPILPLALLLDRQQPATCNWLCLCPAVSFRVHTHLCRNELQSPHFVASAQGCSSSSHS